MALLSVNSLILPRLIQVFITESQQINLHIKCRKSIVLQPKVALEKILNSKGNNHMKYIIKWTNVNN